MIFLLPRFKDFRMPPQACGRAQATFDGCAADRGPIKESSTTPRFSAVRALGARPHRLRATVGIKADILQHFHAGPLA
jgi:hypothetical protein